MTTVVYKQETAIKQIFRGLFEGLSAFCNARIALVLSTKAGLPLYVIDPDRLLANHKRELKKFYQKHSFAAHAIKSKFQFGQYDMFADLLHFEHHKENAVFYQSWFVKLPRNVANRGPVASWILFAIQELNRDLRSEERLSNNQGSRALLATLSQQAVANYLANEYDLEILSDSALELPPANPILNAIRRISVLKEEGEEITGTICFCSRSECDRLIKTPTYMSLNSLGNEPRLEDIKHVRKLSTLTSRGTCLLSDGEFIRGLGPVVEGDAVITARFYSGRASLSVGARLVSTVVDGRFSGLKHAADLSVLEEILEGRHSLTEIQRQNLLRAVQKLVDSALRKRHGCTIVIDLKARTQSLAGEQVVPKFNILEDLGLAQRMSKIDGALQVDRDANLVAFAVLLDGNRSDSEDRSRGARFNSALRFVEKSDQRETIVVVASEDGPVGVFGPGVTPGKPERKWTDTDAEIMQLDHWLGKGR
jgi:hypothetical protein